MRTIKLTKGETEAVQWALDPMADFWIGEDSAYERDGEVYQDESVLPKIANGELALSPVAEINSDLMYRVCEQLPSMAKSESVAVERGQQRISDSLFAKLSAAGVSLEHT